MCKLVAWNANGLKLSKQIRYAKHLLRNYDIVCFSESHSSINSIKLIERTILPLGQRSHTLFWSHGTSASRGVLVVVRNSPLYTPALVASDPNGRFVRISLSFPSLPAHSLSTPSPSPLCFDILAVYAPAHSDSERHEFFSSLSVTPSTIILGDFNTVLDPLQDRVSTARDNTDKSRHTLSTVMHDY